MKSSGNSRPTPVPAFGRCPYCSSPVDGGTRLRRELKCGNCDKSLRRSRMWESLWGVLLLPAWGVGGYILYTYWGKLGAVIGVIGVFVVYLILMTKCVPYGPKDTSHGSSV
nr:putative integron gene cassette protein [uncultured bacterium]